MSQLPLTKQCLQLLYRQRFVYDYAIELLKHSDHSAANCGEEITDYNLVDLICKTKFLVVILQYLTEYEQIKETKQVSFDMKYFFIANEEETLCLYTKLAALKQCEMLPKKLTDATYFYFVNTMFALCYQVEAFDSTPKLDFRLDYRYYPNSFEIKLAINLLGERALDYTPINHRNKCCAV